MAKLLIILAGIALYGAVVVAPWAAQLERVCGAFDQAGYARCSLALQAGQSDAQAIRQGEG